MGKKSNCINSSRPQNCPLKKDIILKPQSPYLAVHLVKSIWETNKSVEEISSLSVADTCGGVGCTPEK
jgi:hypothetical protein